MELSASSSQRQGLLKPPKPGSCCKLSVRNSNEVRVREQFAIDKARFDKLRFICKASEFPAIQRSKLTYDKFKWALCMVRSRFVSSFDNELAQMNVSWLKLGTPYDSGQGSVGRDDSLERGRKQVHAG